MNSNVNQLCIIINMCVLLVTETEDIIVCVSIIVRLLEMRQYYWEMWRNV